MVRAAFKIHLIACYVEDFAFDCYVAFVARDAWFCSVSNDILQTRVGRGSLPSQVARVWTEIGSSFGGASSTLVFGSNLPAMFSRIGL